jgi:tetratricopeptide (TPR) repeat protein
MSAMGERSQSGDTRPTVPMDAGGPPFLIDGTAGGAAGAAPFPNIPGYAVEAELGRGGMGVVYRARQESLNRTVALKMLADPVSAGEREAERVLREAEAIARLGHPNVVAIHEVGRHEGRPFLCLEYCPGGTLAGRLGGRPQPPRSAAETLATLARAVEAAHRCGVVHRDLKPSNVLLTADGTPKLTDFGLAKSFDAAAPDAPDGSSRSGPRDVTLPGVAMGTPAYMAPEQALGRPCGPAADIYALGAILYEMLTGRPPFLAEADWQVLVAHLYLDPVPPSRLRSGVPRDLDTIALKCLAKEPARRYPSAAELADDVGRFLRGEPIRARPAGPVERTVKWARRNPAAAGLVASAVVAGAALLGMGLAYNARLRDAAEAEARQRRRADANLSAALEAADRMLDEIADRLESLPRAEGVRRDLLERAMALYASLPEDEAAAPEIRKRTVMAAHRLGDIHRLLGRRPEARAAYARAAAGYASYRTEFPGDDSASGLSAALAVNRAILAESDERFDEAEALCREAEEILTGSLAVPETTDSAAGPDPSAVPPPALPLLAAAIGTRGDLARRAGRIDKAGRLLRRAVGLREAALTAAGPADAPRARLRLAAALSQLAAADRAAGRVADALAGCRRAAALLTDAETAARLGGEVAYRTLAAGLANNIADAERLAGRPGQAEAGFARARDGFASLAADFPGVPDHRAALADAEFNLAETLSNRGPARLSEAADAAARAEETAARLAAEFPGRRAYRRAAADAAHLRAGMLWKLGRSDEALACIRRAAETRAALAEGSPGDARLADDVGLSLNHWAVALAATPKDAEPPAARAVAFQRAALRATPPKDDPARAARESRLRLGLSLWGDMLLGSGRAAEAAERAGALLTELPADPEAAFEAACLLARCGRPGDADRAVSALREAVLRGFADPDRLAATSELAPLRSHPAFPKVARK